MKKLLILPLLLLAFPTTASAAPTGTICDSVNRAICHTIAATDRYTETSAYSPTGGYMNTATGVPSRRGDGCPNVWQTREAWVAAGSPRRSDTCVKVGQTSVTYLWEKFMFSDIPAAELWRFAPSSKLYMREEIVEGVVTFTGDAIINDHLAAPAGSSLGQYCMAYTVGGETSNPTTGTALDSTPPSVYAACAFTSHQSDAKPEAPKPVQPATLVVPASAARCGSVGKVTVRSTRLACAPARTIMARYARSLKSPAGWTCRMVINDTSRRGSCARKQSGRAARAVVYGVWK